MLIWAAFAKNTKRLIGQAGAGKLYLLLIEFRVNRQERRLLLRRTDQWPA